MATPANVKQAERILAALVSISTELGVHNLKAEHYSYIKYSIYEPHNVLVGEEEVPLLEFLSDYLEELVQPSLDRENLARAYNKYPLKKRRHNGYTH